MTCIIGVEFEDKVYLAGDKQGTSWNGKGTYSRPKVFKKGGAIFGYCASYRYGQLLETAIDDVIPPSRDTYEWLCKSFVPHVRKVMQDNGYEDKDSFCLIGINGELWQLQGEYSVLRSVDGYDSVGSGEEYALGALGYTLTHTPPDTDQELRKVIRNTMTIVSSHCPSVGGKADIVAL